jgi:hypothetical protein
LRAMRRSAGVLLKGNGLPTDLLLSSGKDR